MIEREPVLALARVPDGALPLVGGRVPRLLSADLRLVHPCGLQGHRVLLLCVAASGLGAGEGARESPYGVGSECVVLRRDTRKLDVCRLVLLPGALLVTVRVRTKRSALGFLHGLERFDVAHREHVMFGFLAQAR